MNPLSLLPTDAHNQRLAANVHPDGWVNPPPASRYNLVVIGAGTAGLVIAAGAAGLGAKVALIERDLMGGDCLNFGCVPSKAMIRASRAAAGIRDSKRFGMESSEHAGVNFGAVMERMRRLRADLSVNDSANRFRSLGVDVFLGDARFSGNDTVTVGKTALRFRRAAIATGARAAELPIEGLKETGYLTNETVFALTELPRRIAVIGGGPLGCELAQAFRRFGAEVAILEAASQILIREDRDAAARVEQAFLNDGINLITGCNVTGVERREGGKLIRLMRDGVAGELVVDEIIVGVGRAPAVTGLNLEAAGVAYDQVAGVAVDDYLRTSNPKIFAAGDICSPFKFTHVADAMARIVIRNALFYGRARVSALTIPWCTYTDPEIAHVGLYEADAKARGLEIKTFVQEFTEVDRAILDGETDGMMKVIVAAGSDRIVGATVVASHASEMISEITLAIAKGIGLGAIADVIHPYPTQADALRKLGDQYNRTRLTPRVKRIFERWLAWTR
ncbi:MAG TPA: mercuric reductase [Candidatus Binataceae bacterium]